MILKKLQYFQIGGSEKHLRDIASMLTMLGDRVDRAYLDEWVQGLGVTAEWQIILKQLPQQHGEGG